MCGVRVCFLRYCQSSLETALTQTSASRALPGTDTHIYTPTSSHQAGGIPLMSAGTFSVHMPACLPVCLCVCVYNQVTVSGTLCAYCHPATPPPISFLQYGGNPTCKNHKEYTDRHLLGIRWDTVLEKPLPLSLRLSLFLSHAYAAMNQTVLFPLGFFLTFFSN